MKNNQSLFAKGVAITMALLVTGITGIYGQNRSMPVKSVDQANLISTAMVINEVYGGGGNAGSTYTHDFIELQNRSAAPVDLTGWSVQYASATGTSWQVTNLTGVMVQPGRYHLIQEAMGAGGTTALPTPDSTGTIPMSATAGKVALVNTTVALTGACPVGAQIIDFVGYGATANCFEGAAPTAAPSNTTSVNRAVTPDTDQNGTDFASGGPNPFNVSAARAMIQGRVTRGVDGIGVGGVRIFLSGGTEGPRLAISNPFGYFTFEEVLTGHTYFVSAQSKQYVFMHPTQTVTLQDDVTTLNFHVQP